MKGLEKELRKISKNLSGLAKKLEKVASSAEIGGKGVAKRQRPPKKGKTARSAPEVIMSIIKARNKGVDTATIRAKTGFGSQKVRSVVYELSKKGKIQRVDRGLYKAVK